jgi:hypothetical protein
MSYQPPLTPTLCWLARSRSINGIPAQGRVDVNGAWYQVFKNAMKLYDGIISEIDRGSEFLIRDKDGKVSEFRMFL